MLKTLLKFTGLAAVSAILLASCASIPITNIPKLMALDPETIEIGDVEMAVRLPGDFLIKENGVRLSVLIENDASTEKIGEKFILERSSEPLTKFLKRKQKDGYVLHRYNMTDEAVERATILRVNALKMRNKSFKKNSVTLSAAANFCLKPAASPFTEMRLTFFIRTSPNKSFYTLFKERKMNTKGVGGKMGYCEKVDP